MSISTITPTADDYGPDFRKWESEFDDGRGGYDPQPEPAFRPTRAATRRSAREAIDRGLGVNRHRKHENREV